VYLAPLSVHGAAIYTVCQYLQTTASVSGFECVHFLAVNLFSI